MQTCECSFNETGRLYTYLTPTHYPVGTVVLAEVGEDKVQPVTVRGNHPTPAYLDPRITYRWLLGTPTEIRELVKANRLSSTDTDQPIP